MTTPIISAWTAVLALTRPDREAFLASVTAYTAAETALHAIPVDAAVVRSIEAGRSAPSARPVVRRPNRRHSQERLGATASAAKVEAGTRPGPVPAGPPCPMIGGVALDLGPRPQFSEAAFVRNWRPGSVVHVYVAGCRGAQALVSRLGLKGYLVGVDAEGEDPAPTKVGTARDVSVRMAEHNRLQHGSVSKLSPRVPEPGFASWAAEPLPVATLEPSPRSPVCVTGNGLEIVLPAGMTPAHFDQKLAGSLAGELGRLGHVRSGSGLVRGPGRRSFVLGSGYPRSSRNGRLVHGARPHPTSARRPEAPQGM